MKSLRAAFVVVLLVGMGSGIVIANKANEGDGICITVAPSTLVLSSYVDSIVVHTNIPAQLVDRSSVTLDGIVPYAVGADACGDLVAKFDIDLVKEIVSPGSVTLTLSGLFLDDTPFAASDTIMVKE